MLAGFRLAITTSAISPLPPLFLHCTKPLLVSEYLSATNVSMLERLKWLTDRYDLDENVTRVAPLLNALTLLAIGMTLISAVVLMLTGAPSKWAYVVLAAIQAVALVARVLLHRGLTKLSAIIFLSALFFILSLFAYYTGGLRAASYSALVLLTLYSGFVLGRTGALSYAALFVFVSSGLFALEVTDQLPIPLTERPHGYLLAHLATVAAGTMFILYMMRDVNQGVSDLRRSEEQFRGIFESAPIGMATLTLEGKFLRVNQALCNTLGYTLEELRELTFPEITYPDDLAGNLALTKKAAQPGNP